MLNQYRAPRHIANTRGQRGTIPAGEIIYIQDGLRPVSSPRRDRIRRNPWIVEGWHNRDCMGRIMAGGHLATVRSLRTGERRQVADWILLHSQDLD